MVRRLIERGLMFANLVEVSSPALVERYNRALEHLTGRRTTLTEFHIDISGYSPEIGDELGDTRYLNRDDVNRQFILLSTDQKTAPLLEMTFSTTRGILRQFLDVNEVPLFALTARDAVAGELVNSVYGADTPAQLFDIRRVRIEADTTRGTVADAQALAAKVDRFRSEPGAWHDDVLIAEMIGMAKRTGDVSRNPVALAEMEFAQDNFWTSLFGGLYLFRGVPQPALIAAGDPSALGEVPMDRVMGLADRSAIAAFLKLNDLVEPVVKARGVDAAAILRQKMEFVLVEMAAELGEDLTGATRADMRSLARRNLDRLPPEWNGLGQLLRWAEGGGPWPKIDSDHPAYFYLLRARAHPDADLVNMLLAELSPLDIRQLFICHKPAFYAAYAGWPEVKKSYVADFLEREYLADKSGARAALFGHDAPLVEPEPAPGPWTRDAGRNRGAAAGDDLIDRVGPWGAVGRR